MLQILYLIWLWLVTPTRQESLTSLANSTVLSHAETRKSLFSQTGKGISGQWPLPSPGCSIKGYRPTPKKIASGYCSHVAPGKGRRMLLRTVHLSMGLSCGTIVFLHQLLEGLNCQGHGTSKITCGTSNLVFESCENLHVALSQNVEKNHGSIPLKWPSKSIKQ